MGEAEEQRLKELEEQVLRRQKELEECRAKAREKTLKQRIEEAEVNLRNLNEQLQNANHKVINQEESHSATRISQERNNQNSFKRWLQQKKKKRRMRRSEKYIPNTLQKTTFGNHSHFDLR
jgi:seryl-tRNA synthetase